MNDHEYEYDKFSNMNLDRHLDRKAIYLIHYSLCHLLWFYLVHCSIFGIEKISNFPKVREVHFYKARIILKQCTHSLKAIESQTVPIAKGYS